MRWNYFAITFFLFPFCSFAKDPNSSLFFSRSQALASKTIERSLSSGNQLSAISPNTHKRSHDYPTQIIRIAEEIEDLQLNCDEVNQEIDKILINKITEDKFTYTTYISCTYDLESRIATKFTIKSYFDPISDEGIDYLITYLDQYNGSDLLGASLNIEPAKALVVSLNLSAGMKKNPNTPPFIQYREDRNNHYFKSNYDLQITLITDINKYFLNDEPSKVLPFLDQWIFNHAGTLYKAILRESNYALLQPERIFLMDTGEPIFVSPIKYYYAHNCSKYEHKHCLKRDL